MNKISIINSTKVLFNPIIEKLVYFIVLSVPLIIAYIIWFLYALIIFEVKQKVYIFWFIVFISIVALIFVCCLSIGIYSSLKNWCFFRKFSNDLVFRNEWKQSFMNSPYVFLNNLIIAKQYKLLNDVEFKLKKQRFVELQYIDKHDFILLVSIKEELGINDEEFHIKKCAFLNNINILTSKKFLSELVKSNILTAEEAHVKYNSIIKLCINILIGFSCFIVLGIIFMYFL